MTWPPPGHHTGWPDSTQVSSGEQSTGPAGSHSLSAQRPAQQSGSVLLRLQPRLGTTIQQPQRGPGRLTVTTASIWHAAGERGARSYPGGRTRPGLPEAATTRLGSATGSHRWPPGHWLSRLRPGRWHFKTSQVTPPQSEFAATSSRSTFRSLVHQAAFHGLCPRSPLSTDPKGPWGMCHLLGLCPSAGGD